MAVAHTRRRRRHALHASGGGMEPGGESGGRTVAATMRAAIARSACPVAQQSPI